VIHAAAITPRDAPRLLIGAREKIIIPVIWELPAISILAVMLLFQASSDAATQETMNYVAPFLLSGVLGYAALRMILLDNVAVWSPLFWFRIATIIYFGFGSLVPLISNASTRDYLDSYFMLLPADILKVNAVVAAGVAVILAANMAVESLRGSIIQAAPGPGLAGNQVAAALKYGLFFLAIGAGIKYLIIIPNTLLESPLVIPGFLINLTGCLAVGISLLTIWSLRQKKSYLLIVITLVAFEMLVGLLELSKIEALTPAVAFVIGYLTVKTSIKRLAAVALGFWLMFSLIQPWLTQARLEILDAYGASEQAPFSSRVEFLISSFNAAAEQKDGEELQGSLIRLSFMNAAGFVISRYDQGVAGDSLKDVVYSFIPRFLWPEKPLIVVGGELATLATDTVGNTISAGYFAEVYWNFGWAGLLLLVPIGIVFNVASHFAINTLRKGDWIYLPVLFLNLRTAISIDNFYIGFVGTFVISFGLYLLLRIFSRKLDLPLSSVRRP
jgi:hypothetical protein